MTVCGEVAEFFFVAILNFRVGCDPHRSRDADNRSVFWLNRGMAVIPEFLTRNLPQLLIQSGIRRFLTKGLAPALARAG
jgi:hypothetical protein